MRAVNLVALVAFGVAVFDGAVAALAQAPTATAYEGARLIMGDGRAPIENATLVVDAEDVGGDSRECACDVCDQPCVYGAGEVLIMGAYHKFSGAMQ